MFNAQADIARRFGRAAPQYDAAATIQRLAGARLCALMPESVVGKTVLDIGSGSGMWSAHWQRHGARVLALDIAEDMLRYGRERMRGHQWLVGDAQALPLADASVDVCFSNLALQWCADQACAWGEIHRVLKPGGMVLASSLAHGSMQPLRMAWAAADAAVAARSHVFVPEAKLQAAVAALPWQALYHQAETETVYFSGLRTLLDSLRDVGANHVAGRQAGLTGKDKWRLFAHAYQAWQTDDGRLPLQYRMVYWRAQKLSSADVACHHDVAV